MTRMLFILVLLLTIACSHQAEISISSRTENIVSNTSSRQAIASGTPRDWLHDAAVCCEVQFEWAKPDARLGQDFLNKALPLVESQIRKAGYRLARLLNGLFD